MRQWKIMQGALAVALIMALGATALVAGEEAATEAMDPQAMMEAWMKAGTPGPEHETLAAHAGTWNATVKTWMEPGAEPMVSDGLFQRDMILDGRVLKERFEGAFMEQPFEGMGLTGYDNAKGQYWSIWVDSMSTTMMVAWGQWDEEMGAFVYEGTTTDPMTGGSHWMKTVLTHPEEGKEVMKMYEKRGDQEVLTMEIVSTKQ
jgi:hypothetical protein